MTQSNSQVGSDLSSTILSAIVSPPAPDAAIPPAMPHTGATATGVYVAVHGHFYQPPRENPSLNAIERQPSAEPFHDWNERIHYECYRPNAFARVLNDRGELLGIVNNFEYLSFNIGPTLMSWLERHDVEVYQRILDADRKSCERLNQHGNAIAQVYNHIILPLANDRDKLTQIRWGKADFRARFGRDPEGMWLAETAVDYPTLAALVAEKIKFIVLAPSQAQRCRAIPTPDQPDPHWREVGGSQIDPIQPYRCFVPPDCFAQAGLGFSDRPYIDIFFYDGPISRDMGFNDVMDSSQLFAGRIGQAVRGDQPSQLISVATDGETFGHHKSGAEKALAYALTREFPDRGWTVTNYAHYLSLHPPTWEVELKPVTAWSCSHGVDRWQDDCGCGGGGTWNQKWRRPLRDSLDWLRDQISKVFEETGKKLFRSPWQARDAYIQVVLDRSPTTVSQFLASQQSHKLSAAEKIDALRLLEMQRHALLMYTSCGWFFDELSRPEGTQILRYAARAIELAGDVAGVQIEKPFVKRLSAAPSNVEFFQNGAEVYRQLVIPSQISPAQVAAQYAISSLFTTSPRDQRLYCYTVHQADYQLQRLGSLTLAMGQIQMTSEMTREADSLLFAVLHLGGWDFHCCVQPFSGRRAYAQAKEKLFDSFKQASAAQVILTMTRLFGDQTFSLQDLFAEERHRIMRCLSQETLTRLDQLYTQVYRDNYGVLMAFQRDELEIPQELQVAAEIALSHRSITALQALERELSDWPPLHLDLCLSHLDELDRIAVEAQHLRCSLHPPQIKQTLERLIDRSLWQLFHPLNPETLAAQLQWLARLLDLGRNLKLNLTLDRSQELFFRSWFGEIVPQLGAELSDTEAEPIAPKLSPAQVSLLLDLGDQLAIDVAAWRSSLQAD